jgi:hypothetical protein
VIEVNKLIQILHTNAEALGQEINSAKSEVYFSRNMSPAAQEDLALILGVRLVMGSVKHMGLSTMIGRSKLDTFAYTKDQIWQKINS